MGYIRVGQVQQVFRRDSIFTGHMDQDTGTGTPGRLLWQ